MTDPRFTTDSIPDDEAHWDALASRVAAAASSGAHPLVAPEGAFRWLASGRAALVAASIAAVAALAVATAGAPAPADASSAALQVLGPADDIGQRMASGGAPPSLSALLVERSR